LHLQQETAVKEMRRSAYALAGATLLCLAVPEACAQHSNPQLNATMPPVLYRSASEFAELPGKVILDLERRGCRIPQLAYSRKKTNVIRGEFAKPGQTDWAVLCSIHGVSRILVYWNGSAEKPADIAEFEDHIYSETDAAGRSRFLREINAASKQFILRHYRAYGGTVPPPIDHQGIDDAFFEKASVTWYFYGGKWLQLTGAD
jgi:hypothetical protein